MRTYNRATLIGHVGQDPVLRRTQTGHAVVNLSVATSAKRKDASEITTWHRVVLWDRMAELAERYVKKGQALYLEGPLSSREWTDEHGSRHTNTEMNAHEMIFLGGAGSQGGGARPKDTSSPGQRWSPEAARVAAMRFADGPPDDGSGPDEPPEDLHFGCTPGNRAPDGEELAEVVERLDL